MTNELQRGWASAASVWQCSWLPDEWQWTASGPGGMTMGGAGSANEAWDMARTAQKQLERPMASPRGIG